MTSDRATLPAVAGSGRRRRNIDAGRINVIAVRGKAAIGGVTGRVDNDVPHRGAGSHPVEVERVGGIPIQRVLEVLDAILSLDLSTPINRLEVPRLDPCRLHSRCELKSPILSILRARDRQFDRIRLSGFVLLRKTGNDQVSKPQGSAGVELVSVVTS